MWYLALDTPPLNRRSPHIFCRSFLAEISPPALISAVSAIWCSYVPLSVSEQWEKNEDGEKKRQQPSNTAVPALHGAWPTHSPHPGFVPELPAAAQLQWPEEVQNNVLSRERRKKASGFEIGSSEKYWESTLGVLWWAHGETTVTLVPGWDVNHRATEMTEGLFVWGVRVYF